MVVVSVSLELTSARETGAALDELIQKRTNKFSFLEIRHEYTNTHICMHVCCVYVNANRECERERGVPQCCASLSFSCT